MENSYRPVEVVRVLMAHNVFVVVVVGLCSFFSTVSKSLLDILLLWVDLS